MMRSPNILLQRRLPKRLRSNLPRRVLTRLYSRLRPRLRLRRLLRSPPNCLPRLKHLQQPKHDSLLQEIFLLCTFSFLLLNNCNNLSSEQFQFSFGWYALVNEQIFFEMNACLLPSFLSVECMLVLSFTVFLLCIACFHTQNSFLLLPSIFYVTTSGWNTLDKYYLGYKPWLFFSATL